VYTSKRPDEVSWFQAHPEISLELIARADLHAGARIIDVGGGSSTLVDALVERFEVTVLDIAGAALQHAQDRLGAAAARVSWLEADVTRAALPAARFDLWHDRAVFHFLVSAEDRAAYVSLLRAALKPGGYALLACFAPDGPARCSGLEVRRYDAAGLRDALGTGFGLLEARGETHLTPTGGEQPFVYALFKLDGAETS
jgi:ubiquinone/menaquinone biosynthesis C-methylase UbiE